MDRKKVAVAAGVAGVALQWWLRRRRRMDFDGASVVITGGSRGLGLELARCFAAEGARLTLLARDEDELERARRALGTGAEVFILSCDVTDEAAVRQAVQAVQDLYGGIDVLINNAGVIQVGPVEHMTLDDVREALAVHTWGPLYLIRAVAPRMQAQGGGRIVNVSSIGGLVAVPHLLPYTVSKFALTGLSDGLRAELASDGIRVTTVCPGLMRTGSHVQAWFKGQYKKEFAWFSASASLPLLTANALRAARQIVEACRYGEARLIITPQASLLYAINALMPGLTSSLMKFAAQALPDPTGPEGGVGMRGWESRSAKVPPILTQLGDEAAVRNNQLPDGVELEGNR